MDAQARVSRPPPSPYQSDASLPASTGTLPGSHATLDRHARQRRWTLESRSNARPQRRQRMSRMPAGHRLLECGDARQFRCAIAPCSRMRYAPRSIGPEQMGHIAFAVTIDLPCPGWDDRFHASRGSGCPTSMPAGGRRWSIASVMGGLRRRDQVVASRLPPHTRARPGRAPSLAWCSR